MKSGSGFKEMNQLRNEFEPFFANKIFESSKVCFKGDFAISRLEHNATVIARFDLAMRAQRGRKIHRGGAGMK